MELFDIKFCLLELGMEIKFSNSCISKKSIDTSHKLEPNQIHLLENLRFHSGEKSNDNNFSKY